MARRWFAHGVPVLPQTKEGEEIVGVLKRLEDAVSALNRQVDRLTVIIPIVEAQARDTTRSQSAAAGDESVEEVPGGAGREAD